MRTYDNVQKNEASEGDDQTTGCLLDYPYFNKHYKLIATDLSKQQELDNDPKPILQINFTVNVDQAGNTRMLFIIEEEK